MKEYRPSLFAKQAANEEETRPDLPVSVTMGGHGAQIGLGLGMGLGLFGHDRAVSKNPGTYSLVGKDAAGKRDALKRRAISATARAGFRGAAGAGMGYAIGAGLGAQRDQYDRNLEQTQEYQDLRKELLSQRMEELMMEQEAQDQRGADRLFKTAGLFNNIRKATGRDVRKAEQNFNGLNTEDAFLNHPPAEYFDDLQTARTRLEAEQRMRDTAQENLIVPGLIAGGATALTGAAAYDINRQNKLDEQFISELAAQRAAQEQTNRQGAGSVSHAPAGEDKTASRSLFPSFEKTASPLSGGVKFVKDLTGHNFRKAQNDLDAFRKVPLNQQDRYVATKAARKNMSDARVDKNRAMLAGGVGAVGIGGIAGAYNAGKNPTNSGVNEDMNPYNDQKLAYNQMMSRLEKTAAPNFREMGQNTFDAVRNAGSNVMGGLNDYGQTVSGANFRGATPDDRELALRQMLLTQGATAAGLGAAGAGGYALANRGGGEEEEQLAHMQLMDRLEKTAAPNFREMGGNALGAVQDAGSAALGHLADYGNTVSGANYLHARGAVADDLIPEDAQQQALKEMLIAQGVTAGGLGAAGAGGYALANRGGEEEEQLAFEQDLMNRLQKTAAPIPRRMMPGHQKAPESASLFDKAKQSANNAKNKAKETASNATSRVRETANNVGGRVANSPIGQAAGDALAAGRAAGADAFATGRSYASRAGDSRAGQALGDAAAATRAAGADAAITGRNVATNYGRNVSGANFRAADPDNRGAALRDMLIAQGATGLGVGGAVAGGYALANRDTEKSAGEEALLNDLYKEAAAAIVDETIPPVRQHVDPMSRITFSK